jgi:hypothetical protein
MFFGQHSSYATSETELNQRLAAGLTLETRELWRLFTPRLGGRATPRVVCSHRRGRTSGTELFRVSEKVIIQTHEHP